MTSPLVSIIVPTFQAETYIEDLIHSLALQTFKDFEILCVDDGSQDQTRSLLEKCKALYPNMRIFFKKHEGHPSASRNLALFESQSKYLAFCDHDDLWHPQKLEFQMKAYQLFRDIAFVYSNRTVIHEGTRHQDLAPWPIYLDPKYKIQPAHKVLYNGSQVTFSSVFVEREKVLRFGGMNSSIRGAEDFLLLMQLSDLGRIVQLPYSLCFYRVHNTSISSSDPRLFIQGLYQTAQCLNASKHLFHPTQALALKSDGVFWLENEPWRALGLFSQSLKHAFRIRTLSLVGLCLAMLFIPLSSRRWLKKIVRSSFSLLSFPPRIPSI